MKNIYLLLLLLFVTFIIKAQNPYHILYGIDDGLPSEEIYDVYVDKNDVIWTTTDRGVSRYDGYSFTNASTADGLAYNTNFKIFPDGKGRLWFTGHEGSISIWEDGKFYKSPYSDTLQSMIDNKYYYGLLNDEEGNNYLTYKGVWPNALCKSYIEISKEGIISEFLFNELDPEQKLSKDITITEKKIDNQSIIRIEPYGFVVQNTIHLDEKNKLLLFPIELKVPNYPTFNNISAFQVYLYNQNGIKPVIESEYSINTIGMDNDGNIILCTDNGLKIYRNGDLNSVPDHYFIGTEFSDFAQDSNNNYWISSQKDGLYFIPSFETKVIPIDAKEKMINKLVIYDDCLFYRCGLLDINYINSNNNNITKLLVKEKQSNSEIIEDKNNSHIYKQEDRYFATNEHHKHRLINPYIYLSNGDYLKKSKTLEIISNGKIIKSSSFINNPTKSKVTAVKLFGDDLYYSTLRSFFVIRNHDYYNAEKLIDSQGLLNTRINNFDIDHNGNRWIATVGNGLIYHRDGNKVTQFNTSNGLASNLYNTLYFQNDSTLWLGSNSGLEKVIIGFEDDVAHIKKVDKFNVRDGLLSNYINDIQYWNNMIWVASKEGLQSFPVDIQPKIIPPSVIIGNMIINDSILEVSDNLVLSHDQNDIAIAYKAVSYDKPKDGIYKYKLNRNNSISKWTKTNDKTARFTNLTPGKYVFSISARNKNNIWSESKSLTFTIKPHFTSTWWFGTLISLLGLATVYWIYIQRVRYIIKKNKTERILQEAKLRTEIAELSTFRNQFNPHFIFNSLNSIQNYIFNKDVWQANIFLSNFASLIRESLNLSEKKLVPLQNEIKFLESYLDLEFLRFPDKFQFQIQNEEDLPLDLYMIPPLLMQPVVENVVKHAFKGKEMGNLDIIITSILKDEAISIIIADDGTGIKDENASDNKKNKSFGMKIVSDRIKLLNIDHKTSIASFSIKNNPTGNGTIATFIIPKITP